MIHLKISPDKIVLKTFLGRRIKKRLNASKEKVNILSKKQLSKIKILSKTIGDKENEAVLIFSKFLNNVKNKKVNIKLICLKKVMSL